MSQQHLAQYFQEILEFAGQFRDMADHGKAQQTPDLLVKGNGFLVGRVREHGLLHFGVSQMDVPLGEVLATQFEVQSRFPRKLGQQLLENGGGTRMILLGHEDVGQKAQRPGFVRLAGQCLFQPGPGSHDVSLDKQFSGFQ